MTVEELPYSCQSCGKAKAGDHRLCRACYLQGSFPTPLRRWRQETGYDFRWLERETGVSYATIMRVGAGHGCSGEVALKLHSVTRIPIATLIRGVPGMA